MAFVSRSERKFELELQAKNRIGPGKYLQHNRSESKKSHVPFDSSTSRTMLLDSDRSKSPGPGNYSFSDIRSTDIDQYGKRKPSGTFASSNTRFQYTERSKTPGPGSYDITKPWNIKRRQQTPAEHINWLKLPSAPSIPATNQTYGYEQTTSGDLVLQRNPIRTFSGTPDDSVGPGQYQSDTILKTQGAAWGKSRVKRMSDLGQKAGKLIGPGYYRINRSMSKQSSHTPSASFASRRKRDCSLDRSDITSDSSSSEDENADNTTPGPGYYTQTNKAFPKKPLTNKFGPQAQRFRTKSASQNRQLGPGCYGSLRKPLGKENTTSSRAPFSSTIIRFDSGDANSNPGPGAYANPETAKQKKMWGRLGAFGTTERRFAEKETKDLPGPTSYPADSQDRIGMHNSNYYKESSMFASKNPRHGKQQSGPSPPPGAYEVAQNLIKKEVVNGTWNPLHAAIGTSWRDEAAFSSKTSRFFKKRSTSAHLGPGTYAPKEKLQKPPPKKGIFMPKSERFAQSPLKTPGPGYYKNDENKKDWNKKSFNPLFGYQMLL